MQNLTTKFNILYNANKLLDEAEQNRTSAVKENYQKDLPIFLEPNEISISSNRELMDSIIQKAITIVNDKSESKYIGDAYFLMAKANYEKGNYYNAAEFFSYVANSINPEQIKLMELSLIWKARSLLQIGYLEQVPKVLDSAFMYTANKKHALPLYYATRAQYYYVKHQIDLAIPLLNQAIQFNKDRKENLRWHYILGQWYTEQQNLQQAYAHFNKVVRSNASYELAFNARLNQIFMKDNGADTTLASTVQKLERMLKDDKNKGFTDQIYYIIGETYYEGGNDTLALKSLITALREPSSNDFQKASTYLKIADIKFQNGFYEEAKHYYDSTAIFLKSDFPDYALIQAKITNLDKLVNELNVIKEQDNLQYLAKLPEKERDAALDSLIDSKKKNKIIESTRLTPNQSDFFPSATVNNLGNNKNAGSDVDGRFYFNNPVAISKGLSEFKRQWGNRPHTDNWRISNKSNQLTLNNKKNLSSSNTDTLQVVTDSITKEDLLRTLPLSDSAMLASNEKIIHAYTRLGEIYRDDLKDNPDAITTYLTLLERFPNMQGKELIYYNLYRLYSHQNDEAKKLVYKNLLLTKSPTSIYAKIIVDPQYLNKLNENAQVLNELYTEAYNLYTEQNYSAVLKLADSLSGLANRDKQSGLLVQMDYLKALAIGRTQPLNAFESSLKEIQEKYPNDQLITPLVKEHLIYIDSNRLSLQKRSVALMGVEAGREQFVDEPILTKWPELVFNRKEAPKVVTRRTLAGNLSINQPAIKVTPFNSATNLQGQVKIAAYQQEKHLNSFRDLALLPDSAVYFFVINVNSARVNLSPSRYGIGQFNRGQYITKDLTHQLKRVDDELQLVYIGPFYAYDEAKEYEKKIVPLLPTIMKIPAGSYNTFIITQQNLTKLTDFDQVNDYFVKYQEQL